MGELDTWITNFLEDLGDRSHLSKDAKELISFLLPQKLEVPEDVEFGDWIRTEEGQEAIGQHMMQFIPETGILKNVAKTKIRQLFGKAITSNWDVMKSEIERVGRVHADHPIYKEDVNLRENLKDLLLALEVTPQRELNRVGDIIEIDPVTPMKGYFGTQSKNIGLKPRAKGLKSTWFHEMAHARQYDPNLDLEEYAQVTRLIDWEGRLKKLYRDKGFDLQNKAVHDTFWYANPIEDVARKFEKISELPPAKIREVYEKRYLDALEDTIIQNQGLEEGLGPDWLNYFLPE